MHDLKLALRSLSRSPGFTAVVVLTLALGIAANATVWCWIDHLVWRPLPGVARQDELVVLVCRARAAATSRCSTCAISRRAPDSVFAGAVGFQFSLVSLAVDGQPEWVNAQVVTRELLRRARGAADPRAARSSPTRTGSRTATRWLVISERLWRRRFAADPGVDRPRRWRSTGNAFTVVGVAPDSFPGTVSAFRFDVWAPSSMIWEVRNQRLEGRERARLAQPRPAAARCRRGAGPRGGRGPQRAARAGVPGRRTATCATAWCRYTDCPYGAQAVMGPVLRLLQVVSLGVLLIVAVNVANLSLARASARRKELAIQLALGASRARLVRAAADREPAAGARSAAPSARCSRRQA